MNFNFGEGENYTPLLAAGLCFVAYLPLLFVLKSILTAYIGSVWTLTYMRLTKPTESSSIPIQGNA